jgi:tetratricopeptide (TPR) repeat protein
MRMADSPADTKIANELRKQGNIEAALPIYQEAWSASHDKFAAAGLVNCLRKQRRFEEALTIASEAVELFPDFAWCRNELIWTLIQGQLYSFPEDGNISELLALVDRILKAGADDIAYKVTIFKLVKIARKQENWPLLNEWILKLDPKTLDGSSDEAKKWTYRELWYYYRVTGLLKVGENEEAVSFVDAEREHFRTKNKFFERLRTHALIALGRFDEADSSYRSLMGPRTDWWLLDEYGRFLISRGKTDEGLQYLVRAAMCPPMKLELKVGLFFELGKVLHEKGLPNEAAAHFCLTKLVRDERGWNSDDVSKRIDGLGASADGLSVRDALRPCEAFWKESCGEGAKAQSGDGQGERKRGKIVNLNEGKPFCFVKTRDGESYFCLKRDLPDGVSTTTLLDFGLRPSFDRKKNRETMQATDIRIAE